MQELHFHCLSNKIPEGNKMHNYQQHKRRRPKSIYVKCPYKNKSSNNKDNLTFLGIDKLLDKSQALGPKISWSLALLISCGLCTWQVWLCIQKFTDEPIGNIVEVESFDEYTMPAYTSCPASDRFGYNFHSAFDTSCNENADCNVLDSNARKGYSFDKLGISLLDLWQQRTLDNPILCRRCIHAVDEEACNNKTWNYVHYTDTIIGPCQTYYNDERWAYAGIAAWVFWIESNTTTNPWVYDMVYPFQVAVHTTVEVDRLLIANALIKRYCGNQIGLVMTEFRNVNSKRNPCTEETEVIQCKNKCMNKIFFDRKPVCRWPFLDSDSNIPYCKTLLEIESVERNLQDIRAKVASCDCKRPCKETTYKNSIAYYEIGNSHGVNTSVFAMVTSINRKQIVTEQHAYPISALVAELGGSVGLFLGVALTSVFELIFSLTNIVKHRKNKSQVRKFRMKTAK